MDIYEALAGSVPSEEFYLQNNPLFRSGASVFQAPLPHATSNSEAIFGPLIQGLAGGALVGFGRDQAHRDAFTDAQANPLLNSLSAYAPGATMPEDWNPTKAKSDALLQALNMQQKQAEALQQIKEQSELVRAMLPYSPLAAQAAGDKKAAELAAEMGLGGIPGIPSSKQTQALTETGIVQQLDKSQGAIDRIYGEIKTLKEAAPFGMVGRLATKLNPQPTAQDIQLAAAHTTLVAMTQQILGAEPNAKMQERIAELTPTLKDSPDTVVAKAELAKAFLADLAKSTPTLSAYGVTAQPQQTAGAPTPPPGYELTGNKDANGNWGIRKVK